MSTISESQFLKFLRNKCSAPRSLVCLSVYVVMKLVQLHEFVKFCITDAQVGSAVPSLHFCVLVLWLHRFHSLDGSRIFARGWVGCIDH